MRPRWVGPAIVALVLMMPRDGVAHKLPGFPQVRLVSVEVDRRHPLVQWLTVEVREPVGQRAVTGAGVSVRALHRAVGSGLRVEAARLDAAAAPGTYRGAIGLPLPGRWDLTVEVVGRYVGDAHFELEVAAVTAAVEAARRDKPELPFDGVTVRHLALEWGHLAGFALWLVATGVGLLDPAGRRRVVLAATWSAFAIEAGTGLYKMEYGTPFATPLRLFALSQGPQAFFAEEYVATLVVKHGLMVLAMAATLVLTVHAWRTKPGHGVGLWRALLGANALLGLAIAGAASLLGFYHAIVLHFS